MKWLFLSVLLFPVIGSAQNFQPVASHHVRFFDRSESGSYDLYGMRIDSVVIDGTDSIYFNYPASRDHNSNAGLDCRFKRYSFVGSSVIVKDNGWTHFVNQDEDTIKINHLAQLNDTWPVLNISSNSIVWATVTDVSSQAILGMNDNVKTISFMLRAANNSVLAHPMNGKTIKIGETFGLVKSIDFHHFPDHIEDSFHDDIFLVGAEGFNLGLRRPREELLFKEFNIGDEFAFRYSVNYHGVGQGGFNAEQYDTLIQIIDKQTQPQLQYTLAIHSHSRVYQTDPLLGPIYVHDYSSATSAYLGHGFFPFYNDSICHRMPFEMFRLRYGDLSFNTEYEINGDTVSFEVFSTQFGDVQTNGCIADYFFEYLPWNVNYSEHLGAFWGQTGNAYDDTSYQLLYLKRGNHIYGTPITVSEILSSEEPETVSHSVFPNPTRVGQSIQLSLAAYETANLYAIDGKQIPVEIVNGTMKTDNLVAGIYLIQVATESGVSTQKLVVTN